MLSSLTSSQTPTSVITDDVRVIAQQVQVPTASNSSSFTTSISIVLPLTDDEKAKQAVGLLNVPSISLAVNTSSSGNSSFYAVVALLDASLWPSSPSSAPIKSPASGTLQSDIIAVSIGGSGVQSVDITFSPNLNFNVTPALNYTITCPPLIVLRKAFVCNDTGYVEVVDCKGETGTFKGSCPVMQQTCASLELTSLTLSSENLCQTVRSAGGAITCRCVLAAGATDGSTAVAAGVVTSLESSELSNTFEAVSAFSDGSAASKAATLIGLFAGMWGATLMVMFFFSPFWQAGKKDNMPTEGKIDTDAGSQQRNRLNLRRNLIGAKGESLPVATNAIVEACGEGGGIRNAEVSLTIKKQMLDEYINSLFPSVFTSPSILDGLVSEVYNKHTYINLFFRLHKSQSPLLDLLKIATSQSLLLFLLALLYDISYPSDDGSCITYMTKNSCLHRRYDFDPTRTYCMWTLLDLSVVGEQDSAGVYPLDDEFSEGFFNCVYMPPTFSFTMLMYVSMAISLATCVVQDPLEFLCSLLGAPTAAAEVAPTPPVGTATIPQKADETKMDAVNTVANPKQKLSSVRPAASTDGVTKGIKERRQSMVYRRIPASVATPDTDHTHHTIMPMLAHQNAQHAHTRSRKSLIRLLELELLQERTRLEQLQAANELDMLDKWWCLERHTGQFLVLNMGGVGQHRQDGEDDNEAYSCCQLICCSPEPQLHVRRLIKQEMLEVSRQAEKMRADIATQTTGEQGFELLVQFVQDLLGRKTAAARIYAAKIELDFEKVRRVRAWVKVAIVLFLLGINSFFVYFTMLRGINKGVKWQRSYVTAWLVQCVLDIVIFETLQCSWFHFVVPSLVSHEVNEAHELLRASARCVLKDDMQHIKGIAASKNKSHLSSHMLSPFPLYQLDVSPYFFVSRQLLLNSPLKGLLEGRLILAVRCALPGAAGLAWQQLVSKWQKKYGRELGRQPRPQTIEIKSWYAHVSWLLSQGIYLLPRLMKYCILQVVIYIPQEMHNVIVRVMEPAVSLCMGMALFVWGLWVCDCWSMCLCS